MSETVFFVLLFLSCALCAWNHKYVILGSGLEVHYVEAGDPANPAVLMIHGYPDLWYTWRFQIPELAKNYHVIAYDQRGYGLSDHPSYYEMYNITFLTIDAMQLLNALHIEKAHIIGHDWGAIVAWTTAFLFPERLLSVTCLSVPYLSYLKTVEDFATAYSEEFYIVQYQKCGVPEKTFNHLRPFLQYVFTGPLNPARRNNNTNETPAPTFPTSWFTEGDLAFYFRTFSKTGMVGAINYYRNWNRNIALIAKIARSKSFEIHTPSLMISGAHDLPFLLNTEEINSRFLKHPRPPVMIDAGHFMHLEKAPEVTKAIMDFLDDLTKESKQGTEKGPAGHGNKEETKDEHKEKKEEQKEEKKADL